MRAKPPIIALREAALSIGDKTLFIEANISIADGDRICLVGRNGSGKSTLLRLIAGLEEVTDGEIFIDDNPKKRFPIIGNKTQNYNISLLQEDYSHHEELSSGLAKESIAIRGGMGSRLLCPFCTGSGLTSVFNLPESWTVEVENETYQTCSGWLKDANDCFAYKGTSVTGSSANQ